MFMLRARLKRWFHCMGHIVRLQPEMTETVTVGWRTVYVGCSCGKVFK